MKLYSSLTENEPESYEAVRKLSSTDPSWSLKNISMFLSLLFWAVMTSLPVELAWKSTANITKKFWG